MPNKQKVNKNEIFVKKQIKDLVSGDIILHPIFRSDGLMLIKQYRHLFTELALKIKQMVPGTLPVIVLSSKCDMDAFNENQYYNSDALFIELEKVRLEYSEFMQFPLEISALVDSRARINDITGFIAANKYADSPYLSFLLKSPLFSTFEERLESSHLQLRAKRTKELLIDTLVENKIFLSKLNELKDYKDIILLHSINTTCVVLMIGLTLELTEDALLDLALANLLIDISVSQIPDEEFELHLQNKKPSGDFYSLHLEQLKLLTRNIALIRKESILCGVLDQYEQYNGKGYPKGKKSSDINLLGRIISIAQAYDEMVGGYFYNNGIKPIQALQNIWENRGNKFDPDIVRILIDRTTILKIGQPIILSSTHRGTIMGFADFINNPLSPIIKLQDESIIDLLEADQNKME